MTCASGWNSGIGRIGPCLLNLRLMAAILREGSVYLKQVYQKSRSGKKVSNRSTRASVEQPTTNRPQHTKSGRQTLGICRYLVRTW